MYIYIHMGIAILYTTTSWTHCLEHSLSTARVWVSQLLWQRFGK